MATNRPRARAMSKLSSLGILAALRLPCGGSGATAATGAGAGDNDAGRLPPQTPYLLEIVTGRCYDRPPFLPASPSSPSAPASPTESLQELRAECPVLVPALVGALQGLLDREISVQTFEPYLSRADFAPPRDRALLVLDAAAAAGVRGRSPPGADPPLPRQPPRNQWGENGEPLDDPGSDRSSYFLPPSLVRPEDTPGGSLLKGLSFCGADLQESGCDFGDADPAGEGGGAPAAQAAQAAADVGANASTALDRVRGAQASFWAGAYRSFAASAAGKVRVVVLGSELRADEARLEEEGREDATDPLSSSFSVRNRLLWAAVVPHLPPSPAVAVEVYSQSGCDRPSVREVGRGLESRGIRWTCEFDRDLMRLFRGAGYFLGDQEPPPAAGAAEEEDGAAVTSPPGKRKGRFHFLRDFALGLGMVLTGLAAMLLALGLRGRLHPRLWQPQRTGEAAGGGGSRYPYDKIPQEVIVP